MADRASYRLPVFVAVREHAHIRACMSLYVCVCVCRSLLVLAQGRPALCNRTCTIGTTSWRFPLRSILEMRNSCPGGLYVYEVSRRMLWEQLCLLSFLLHHFVYPIRLAALHQGHTYLLLFFRICNNGRHKDGEPEGERRRHVTQRVHKTHGWILFFLLLLICIWQVLIKTTRMSLATD